MISELFLFVYEMNYDLWTSFRVQRVIIRIHKESKFRKKKRRRRNTTIVHELMHRGKGFASTTSCDI